VYVQEGIYDQFVRKAAVAAKNWTVGDPFNPNIHQGPQVYRISHDWYNMSTFFSILIDLFVLVFVE
jgi:acyl-CoA reductase-like NAD-dependent aldehyde dehydrogenase